MRYTQLFISKYTDLFTRRGATQLQILWGKERICLFAEDGYLNNNKTE